MLLEFSDVHAGVISWRQMNSVYVGNASVGQSTISVFLQARFGCSASVTYTVFRCCKIASCPLTALRLGELSVLTKFVQWQVDIT